MKRLVIAIAALALPAIGVAPALAHTSVVSTSIAENARLASAPETFAVEFSAPVGLASVTLTDSEGVNLPVAFERTRQMTARHMFALPRLTAGNYVLSWRTIARDGHAMSGTLHFAVTG